MGEFDKEAIRRSFEEFEKRQRYSALDAATIAGIKDDDLEQAIVDFVLAKVGDNFEREYEVVTALPIAIQDVFNTWVLENEVANGGFNQYFWNSSGQFAEEAVEGLKRIGAPKHSALLLTAMERLLANGDAWGKHRKIGTLEAFSESYDTSDLGDLDDAFYAAGELSPIRVSYIRTHPEQFTTA
jgi:hypothetical protein